MCLQIVSYRLDILLLQPVQYGCQIPTVATKLVVVFHIPPLLEVGAIRGVVELKSRTIPEQVDDHRSGCQD